MTRAIDCETAMRRLWDYVDGTLPALPAEEVARHLDTCAACTSHVRAARALRGALAATRAPADDAPALRDRVRAALRALAD